MAILFNSFPYDDGSMDEQDWKAMMQWVRTDGILTSSGTLSTSGDLYVTSYLAMTIQVYPGLAWVQGFYFSYTTDGANYTITIAPNSSADPRIDLIVLRLDLNNNNITIETLQGVPAVSPIPPVLTQNNFIWEIPLAQVAVASGAVTINPGDITDERVASTQGTVGSTVTLSNAGIGNTLVVDGTGPSLSVKGLSAGTNVSISTSGNDLVISSTGASVNNDLCIITKTASQTITASASAAITWDATIYDPNNLHSNITNNSRITILNSGIYLVGFNITCTPEVCTLSLLKNGTTTVMDGVYGAYMNPTRFLSLVATDYIEVIATNTHTVTSGVIDFVSGQKPIFQVIKVG